MKIAIVTGASSGMGREFVRQLGYFYKNLDEIWVIARRKGPSGGARRILRASGMESNV